MSSYVHPNAQSNTGIDPAHHDDANPYGWHMSCERFLEKRVEILMDDNLDRRAKYNLIGYFKSKVPGECNSILT